MFYPIQILSCLFLVTQVSGYLYSSEKALRDLMFTNYSDSIRPVLNQNDTVSIHFTLEVLNIGDLDIRTQAMEITIWAVFKWKDQNMVWDSSANGDVTRFFVHSGDDQDVWKPDVSVLNSVGQFQGLRSTDTPIIVTSAGDIIMESGKVINAHCNVDVTYYPFDSQSCELIIGAWVYSVHEVNLTTEEVNFDNYRPNGEWMRTSHTAERHDLTFDIEPQSVLWYTFNLKRRRPFFTMHFILPMMFLSVLNVIVFLLPPDSGEKIGLSITNLLSFAVFLTLFSDYMPHSSQHTPILSTYLLSTFVISVLSVVISALVLKLYFREGTVPRLLKVFFCRYLSRILCSRRESCPACFPGNYSQNDKERPKTSSLPSNPNLQEAWTTEKSSHANMSSALMKKSGNDRREVEHDIAWRDVALLMDWCAFWLFLTTTVTVGVVVLVLLTAS